MNTDENNIKALDVNSANALIKHLDENHFKPTDDNIVEDNELFSESSKDIIYKLNALYMISDKDIAKDYKNEKGEFPTIELIKDKGKFLPSLQMKKNLESFSSEIKEKTISFKDWVKDIAKIDFKNLQKYLYKVIENNYSKVEDQSSWRTQIDNLWAKNNEKNLIKFLDYQISPKISPKDYKKLWEFVINFFKNLKSSQGIANSISSNKATLTPNSIISISDILKTYNLTPEQGFRQISMKILKIKDKEKASSYYNAFKKVWDSKRYREDFLNSKVKITSKGNVPWAQSIIKYLQNIKTPQGENP